MGKAKAKSKTAPKKVADADLERRAMQMRIAGASYDEIAVALKISHSTAHVYVRTAMDRALVDSAELVAELRSKELLSLDIVERRLWQMAVGIGTPGTPGYVEPNLKAIDRLVRIKARRAALMGLDGPTRLEVSDPGNITDAREKLLAQLLKQIPETPTD